MGLTEIYAASCRYYYKIVEQIGLSPKLLLKSLIDNLFINCLDNLLFYLLCPYVMPCFSGYIICYVYKMIFVNDIRRTSQYSGKITDYLLIVHG